MIVHHGGFFRIEGYDRSEQQTKILEANTLAILTYQKV